LGLGEHHDNEFLEIDGARVHIFDCFALVNFLVCSAVPAMSGNAPLSQRIGGRQGRSTPTMRQNCSRHFQKVLEILEPTLVVAQGHGVRQWIGDAYGLSVWSSRNRIERLTIAGNVAELVTFSHPSALGSLNWGANSETQYLRDVVKPTIDSICPSE
jgi:uracil-DNA glycosylase